MRFCNARFSDRALPRGAGAAASILFLASSVGYGVVKGDHVSMIVDQLKDTRDAVANAVGFGIGGVSVSGATHVSRDAIFAAAGLTGHASLLFLDVEAARARIKAIPWISEATVRKLYPDRLMISVTERQPFALWQMAGRVSVISEDGTPIAPLLDATFASLPLVVGSGAAEKAREFLALLAKFPGIRDQVRAAVYVGERRWNLRLKNGVDVRLPESGIEQALGTLAELDRTKQVLSRDIVAIDLRLPDRVSVRLSDDAARTREEARKDKAVKRKGGDA